MIKITSFYPFRNFLRITQEFYEDKAVVKIRSLTVEREFEFKYSDVSAISSENIASSDQMIFGFRLLALVSFVLVFFGEPLATNLILLRIVKISYVIAVMLFMTGFIKNNILFFFDNDRKGVTYAKATQKNRGSISKIIESIKGKAGIAEEFLFKKPFPERHSAIELVQYDIPKYFSKTTTRFYDDELIELNNSFVEDSVSKIKYNQLSGEIYRGKESNDGWDSAFWVTLVFSGIIGGFYVAFGGISGKVILWILGALAVLLIIFIILRFTKQEIVGFYDRNNRVVYWTWVNKSNKDKIEEIIEFVKSRIPADTAAEEQ
jgi:hypothetical protein